MLISSSKDKTIKLWDIETYNEIATFEGHSDESKNSLRCKRLLDILETYNIKRIDFFSLDVEGSEIEVLESFNFTVPVKSFEKIY